MGDVAELMLDGTICEECGGFIDDNPPGHPRKCPDCEQAEKEKPEPRKRKPK